MIYEVPEHLVQEVGFIIKHCMENAIQLNVPLKVKLFSGRNWGDLQPLVINSDSNLNESNSLKSINNNNIDNNKLQPIARCIFKNDSER